MKEDSFNRMSKCFNCKNEPCKRNEPILPNSFFIISDQFKKKFGFDAANRVYIKDCSGYNQDNFTYFPEQNYTE